MTLLIPATKLHIPLPPQKVVLRPRLTKHLNAGLHGRLTLIAAPAGFGKTTLASAWVRGCGRPVAWLSLDEQDCDPTRLLTGLIAALQTVRPTVGIGLLPALRAPQPSPVEAMLTTVLNDLMAQREPLLLVLEDYHAAASPVIDYMLAFLLNHLPAHLHVAITTRQTPELPLSRLRARSQMNEVSTADLRFTPDEVAYFLSEVMGLALSTDTIAVLDARIEGWVAGLQLAALALQTRSAATDAAADGLIESFSGSHRFIQDYLTEEVLRQQSAPTHTFLLQTAILERMCGALCDAVLGADDGAGQETLEYLERANLFIIPLDTERRWYRYHHLFADLLRQRLSREIAAGAQPDLAALHGRASQWYEDNGLELEAFHHAVAAQDVDRAERLMLGKGLPLHLRGAAAVVLAWLAELPAAVLDARPWLWLEYASLLLMTGQTTSVEEKLQAAESVLGDQHPQMIGRIASMRATLALTRYDIPVMLTESRRALDHLRPEQRTSRATALWTQGYVHLFQRDYAAARTSLMEAIALAQAAGSIFVGIVSAIGLALVYEAENQLDLAAETYQRVLDWAAEQPLQIVSEAYLGLARLHYEWNDLDAAERYGQQSLQLARQYDQVIDRSVSSEVFLARLHLVRGDVARAARRLVQVEHLIRRKHFAQRVSEVTSARIEVLLRLGDVDMAEGLARAHDLPLDQVRVLLAQRECSTALALVAQVERSAEANGWQDEFIRARVLHTLALDAHGDSDAALMLLLDTLTRTAPQRMIRTFVDAGPPMARLLNRAASQLPDRWYTEMLLAACAAGAHKATLRTTPQPDALSARELEVLRLIAQGLSNREIGERLFLALDTVKGHNRRIFEKLRVQRRTEAISRARELGLI